MQQHNGDEKDADGVRQLAGEVKNMEGTRAAASLKRRQPYNDQLEAGGPLLFAVPKLINYLPSRRRAGRPCVDRHSRFLQHGV